MCGVKGLSGQVTYAAFKSKQSKATPQLCQGMCQGALEDPSFDGEGMCQPALEKVYLGVSVRLCVDEITAHWVTATENTTYIRGGTPG